MKIIKLKLPLNIYYYCYLIRKKTPIFKYHFEPNFGCIEKELELLFFYFDPQSFCWINLLYRKTWHIEFLFNSDFSYSLFLYQGIVTHLCELRSNNHTQIALRVYLQPPNNVNYRLGSSYHGFGFRSPEQLPYPCIPQPQGDLSKDAELINELNELILPVLHQWGSRLRNQIEPMDISDHTEGMDETGELVQTLGIELDFSLLD